MGSVLGKNPKIPKFSPLVTCTDIMKYFQSRKSIEPDQLYCVKNAHHKLTEMSRKLENQIFRGNIYHAILMIDEFLKPEFSFIWHKFEEVQEDRDFLTTAVMAQEMITSWTNSSDFCIVEYRPVIH